MSEEKNPKENASTTEDPAVGAAETQSTDHESADQQVDDQPKKRRRGSLWLVILGLFAALAVLIWPRLSPDLGRVTSFGNADQSLEQQTNETETVTTSNGDQSETNDAATNIIITEETSVQDADTGSADTDSSDLVSSDATDPEANVSEADVDDEATAEEELASAEALEEALVENAQPVSTDETSEADSDNNEAGETSDEGEIIEATQGNADDTTLDIAEVTTEEADQDSGSMDISENETDTETGGENSDEAVVEINNLTQENQELSAQIAILEAQIAEAQSGSQAEIANMTQAAEMAKQAAAANTLRLAMADGSNVEDIVPQLEAIGVEIPEETFNQATNAPTHVELEDAFGAPAMDAIRASIMASEGDGFFHGIWARVKSEYVGRSLSPVEGMTPDAVLSRAEYEMRNGDLSAALGEISVLPSEAQAAMQPWVDQANQRLDALSAVDKLATPSETN